MGREAIIDVSLRFNYEKTHGSLNNLKKGLREIGESVDVDSPIREQVNRIEGAVDELQNKLDSLKLGKISSTAFNNAVNDINSSVDELSKRMLALESLFQGSGDGASNLLNNAKSELKSVVNMANEAMDAVKKIREASGANSINIIDTKELENRKKKLKQLSDAIETAEEGGFSIKDKTKFNSRTDKENLDLYINRIEELTKLQQKLSSTKVDDPGFADLAKDVATYSASVSKLYNAITEKMTETGSDTFAGMKLSGIDDLYNNAAKAMSSARDVIDKGVRDINDSMAALGNKSNEPETITLDFKTSTTELKEKLIKMISALQQVAASHPVEVELNFTSGWATKKNKKLLKEFETKINSLTDKTTKEEMQKLVDDISASFGNRLDFEIKSEKLDDVEKKVKDLVDNLKDILKEDFSVEISKASFSDDVKSTLQDSLNDIAKNLKIVIDNVELGENVNVADLQQAVSNINNTISNPRLSDILRQIYEANKDMDDSKFTHTDNINGQEVERYFTSLERKLYVNSKTGWIGNPFYAGIREGTPRFNKQIAEAKSAGADVGIHTHPSSLSAMSYFSTGDFKSFYDQFIFDKMKKQVVSSRIDAEIFDVEGFFSKYADLIDFANQSVWDELTKEESKFQEQYRKIPNRDRFYSFFKDQMTDEDYDTFISNILEKYALQKDLDVLKKNGSIKSQLEKIYANDKNTNITTAINQLLRGSLSDKHIQRLTSRKDIDFNGAITGSITKVMASHGYDLQDAFQYHYGQYMKTAVENAWGKYSKDGKSTKDIGEDLVNNFIKIVPSEKLDEALGISGISQAASEATSSTKTLGDALQEIVNILNEIKAGSNFADIFKGVFEESSELKSFLDSLKIVFNTIEEINGALTNASPTDTLGDMSGISTTIENINLELTTLVGILKSFPDISNQIKLDDTFKAMADYTEQLDDINLKDGNMKSVYKDLISNYWDYVKSGGTKDITELTSNKKAQKKLKNGYESYLKLHPLPNIEDDAAKMKSSIETIVKAVIELRTSVGENFGSIFSGDLGFKDAVTGIQDVGNALFSLLEIIEKFTGISSSATLDKLFFNLGFETETMGNIDARSKAFKNIIKQYDEYVKAGGTKKISDLTPDEAVKKKLDTGYSNYIKKQQNAEKASRAAVKARESVMKAEEEEIASFGAVAVPVDEVDEKNDKLQKSFEEVVNGIKDVQTSISTLKDSLNFSEGVTGINTLVSSMENLIALLEKMSGFKSKATLDNIFSNLSETTKAQSNLKANSKIFKDILGQYDEYSQLGGTKDITELTDDVKLQEKLRAKYAEYVKARQEAEAVSKQQATTSQTSAESATKEASALQGITSAATAAATAKELFTKANQGVNNSAIKSADSVDAEGNAMSSVAKIASQMHEANILMGQNEDAANAKERGFFFNTATSHVGNPFLVGSTGSFPQHKLDKTGMNAFLHTHPATIGSLSLIDKHGDSYSGDLVSFISQLEKGIYTQIISGSEESQIIDFKGFAEKYSENLDHLKKDAPNANKILREIFRDEAKSFKDSYIRSNMSDFVAYYIEQLRKDEAISNDDVVKLIDSLENEASIFNNGDVTKYLLDKFEAARSNPDIDQGINHIFDYIFRPQNADVELENILEKIQYSGYDSIQTTFNKLIDESELRKLYRDVVTPKFFDALLGEGAGEDFMKNFQRVVKTEDLDEALGMKGVSAQASNLVETDSLIKEISAILSGFGDGAKGFEALNKIVNNLGGKNGDAKLQATVDGLRQIFEILNTPMSESSMMEAITKIADSGEKLKDLATVLKSTKKDLDNASKTVAGENQPNTFTEDEFEKERKILEEGRKYLSNYGQVLDVVLSRGKNGMTNLVSRVMGEDPNTHEKKIQEVKLTTADGRYFTRDYIKQNTADLAKYMMQMQRAKEFAESRMKFGTEEVFLKDDTDEETWNKLISYASQYAEQIGNILKITRQTRQNASGNLLESFTFVGDKGHVTMGQEFDEVASSQTYTNPQQIASAYDNLTRSVNAYVKAKMESSLKSGDFGDTAAINEIDTLVNKLTIDTQEANQKLGSMQNIAQEAKVRYEDALSGAYDNYINDFLKKAQGQVDRANATRANQRNGYTEEYLEQLKKYKEVSDELKTLRESHQAGQLWNNDELEKTVQLIQTIERILPGLKDNNNILAKTSDIDKELSKLNKDLADNSISGELLNRYMTLVNYLNQVRTAGEGAAEGLSQISKIELGKVKDEVQDLHNQMIQTGQYGKGFWKQFTGAITSSSANFLATYFSLQDIIRYAQDITSTVTAIDSALIELQKVSDASNERIQQNFEKSAQTAQDMGATITDVINSTSDWARQGYTVDESEELARVTQLYQNVGDNISQEEASKSLVSTLQGFQLGADQAESVIDKFNEVANNFSIDTYGIGQALERSAASFYASGTDLSKAVALVTTANTVLQNPESVGI